MVEPSDLSIPCLGRCRIRSPIGTALGPDHSVHFVAPDDRILFEHQLSCLPDDVPPRELASIEAAGPRQEIFFDPVKTRCGVVTCGGLCPGINDVIRGLVMELWHRYSVRTIYGFQYGYEGLAPEPGHPVLDLKPELVTRIHETGGTILGSSRGEQDVAAMVDCLERMSVSILFVIGGDGTMRGALAISQEISRRGLPIAVVGIPKTIDNDIPFIDQSFGFESAVAAAGQPIRSAHTEALGAPLGIGLVKLMGRHSGFIACHAALAVSDVNIVLIPEVPFELNGSNGLLAAVADRLDRRQHAVIVVAEGAGQDLLDGAQATDASGNVRLQDIGPFLRSEILDHFAAQGRDVTLKYIDPSYIIRSVPASPADSIYCWRLAQNAVHAAMCGKTEMLIGLWHGRLVHVPMRMAISERKQVDPAGNLWLSVLEATGQPPRMSS
jgi:6-phosphofructokinase 1